jgi:parvulin-like peptidyl-prolyl isomerase
MLKKIKLILKNLKKLKLLRNKKVILAVAILTAVAILYFAKSLFIAAIVNGKPILRYSLTRELERLGGASTLNNIIEKSIVYAEAKKLGKAVSQEEVDAELTKVEETLKEQGLTLEQALSIRGQTKEELSEQIKYQKTVEKLLADKISITDAEIADYFKNNKDLFNKTDALETVKEDIRKTILQQKLTDEYQKWLTEIKDKAKIFYFVKF